MEDPDKTSKLFTLLQPGALKHEDTHHFSEVLSSEKLENDDYDNGHSLTRGHSISSSIRDWKLFGKNVPKNEVIFICQVVVLYIIILTCIVNLSLANGDSNLWTALLSSSLGIMLPAPTLSRKRR